MARLPYVVLFSFVLATASVADQPFEVGTAKVDITPEYPVRLNGFGFRRQESEGVGQRIFAKALAIRHDKTPPILIYTVDNLGLRLTLLDRVHKRLQREFDLPRVNMALTFTHTHCAPKVNGSSDTIFSNPIPDKHQEHIDKYTRELEEKLVLAGRTALKQELPAKLSWGIGKVGFAVNRRTRGGPVDHSLPILFVESLQGKVRAVLTTYACHCVTLSYNRIHGDWAGSAAISIEKMYPDSIGMISIGLGSDSNPSTGVTGADEKAADRLGVEIAKEVKKVFDARVQISPSEIKATFKQISLPLEKRPSLPQLENLAEKGGPAGYNAQYQLKILKQKKKLISQIDYPVQTIQFGESLAMVFLGGEVCVDYAIELRKILKRDQVWFHGYANDFCSYIPSERLVKEGGYGGGAEVVYFGLPATLKPGLEAKIIREVKLQVSPTFYAPQGTRGSSPKSPKESIDCMKLSTELPVTVVACEPVIRDPVAIDFGFEGEVWVVEMPDYAKPVDQSGDQETKGQGVVKRLIDQDADGKFESQTVFLSGLRFPTGVTTWRNGILVCDAPHVLYAEDTDSDGVADNIEIWLSGFETHNPHARVNSLEVGLDGWIYGSGGLFGGMIKTRNGKVVDLRGRDFRWKPATDELEPATGRSQQGRVRDDWDLWYGCDNSTLLKYYIVEDRHTKRNPNVPSPPTQISPLRNPPDSTLFPSGDLVLFKLSGVAGRPTSACGIGFYRDQRLGNKFYGNVFTCEPVNQLIHRRTVTYGDRFPAAERVPSESNTEFLTSSDQWFRPVQIKTGPDGCLWVVDMYRYVIEHPRWIPESTKSELDVFAGTRHGRIYRIGSRPDDLKSYNLKTVTDKQLVELASSSNGTLRDLAAQYLVWKRRADLLPELFDGLPDTSAAARSQILSIAFQLEKITPEILEKFLKDSDPMVQRQAIRFAENVSDDARIQSLLLDLSNSNHWMIRRQAFWSLSQGKIVAAKHFIAKWPDCHNQPYLRHAILSSIHGESIAAWRKFLYANPDPPDSVYLDEDLLRSVVEQAAPADWSEMFRQIGKKNHSQDLLHDQRFVALVRAWPSGKLEKEVADSLRKFFQTGIDQIIQQQMPAEQQPSSVAVLGNIATGLNIHSEPFLDLLHASIPVETQVATGRMVVARFPNLWNQALQRIQQCTPIVRQACLTQWIVTAEGRQFLLDQISRQSGIRLWIGQDLKQKWLKSATQNEALSFRKVFNEPPPKNVSQLFANYQTALARSGNLDRGRKVFLKNCAACHRFGLNGSSLGPDLAAVANKSRERLLRSILTPSDDIDAKYLPVIISLKSGIQLSGLVADESSSSIELLLNEKESKTLLRKDIERMRVSSKSFMPDGFEKKIDKAGMTDLLTFLMSDLPTRKSFPGNTPMTIDVQGAVETEVPASAAMIFGKEIRFEQQFKNIGYWHHQNDYVAWSLNVDRAGEFSMELVYSCDKTSAGNILTISSSTDSIDKKIQPTAGWADYQTCSLGSLKIEKGMSHLTIRPKLMVKGALMDLKSVRLIRKK